MAKLSQGEDERNHCALSSCLYANPKLYDDRTELCFCDTECFTEYLVENPDDFVEGYAELYLYETN